MPYKSVYMWGEVILRSLFGLVGACISSLAILFALVPLMERSTLGLLSFMGLEGACFVPFGVSLGLSIGTFLKLPSGKLITLSLWFGFGGLLYGAFSFFSIGGTIAGCVVLAFCAAAAISTVVGSWQQSAAAAGGVAFSLVLALLIPKFFAETSIAALSILDPLRTLRVVDLSGVAHIAGFGYFLNAVLLTSLILSGRSTAFVHS